MAAGVPLAARFAEPDWQEDDKKPRALNGTGFLFLQRLQLHYLDSGYSVAARRIDQPRAARACACA